MTKTTPYSIPKGMLYILKFDSAIEDADYYSHFCDVLMTATEEDNITIYFATPGGMQDTAIAIINMMSMCQAPIHGVLLSDASSAGSLLFLECDTHEVGRFVTMLCHQVSYGIGGSQHEIKSHVEHYGKIDDSLTKEIYEGFLTEDEIDAVLRGHQMYLGTEEIMERLVNREQFFADRAMEEAVYEYENAVPSEAILKKLNKSDLIKLVRGGAGVNMDTGEIVEMEEE